MGRNGAGKTTTLRALMGLVTKRKGSVVLDGEELLALPTHQRFHRGLAYVPEERRIVAGAHGAREPAARHRRQPDAPPRTPHALTIDEIAETFPRLKERLDQDGTSLSGGEQQMLAIARAMMAKPKMILLDEPSEGIMPILVDELFALLGRMKRDGDHDPARRAERRARASRISDRAYIVDEGRIVLEGTGPALLADRDIQARYCAV